MAKDENKSKGSGALAAIMFIIMFFLLIDVAAAALVYFNVGGIRPKLIDYLNEINGTRTAEIARIDELTAELSEKDRQLNELKDRSAEVESLKTKLEEDELIRVAERQRESDAVRELNAKLSSQIDDLNELVKMYEKMEPANAADILLQVSDSDLVTKILKNMKAEAQALVLSQMPPERAASYTKNMVSEKND